MESKAMQEEAAKKKEMYEKIKEEKSSSLQRKLLQIQKQSLERTKFQEDSYENEYLDLKRKYDIEYEKLFDEINSIIKGSVTASLSEEDQKKYGLDLISQGEPIANYWLEVLKNGTLFLTVNVNDEKILKHLNEVKLVNSQDRLSFTVEFHFSPNDYFTQEVLTKSYIYDTKDHQLCRTEASKVDWKSEDLIPNKIKKTKTVKKGKNIETKVTEKEVESFFDIFTKIGNSDEDNKNNQEEGEFFKDDLIPFSMEYYLQLVDRNLYSGECGDDCGNDH